MTRAMTLRLMCIKYFDLAFLCHLSIHPLGMIAQSHDSSLFNDCIVRTWFSMHLMFGCTEKLTINKLLFMIRMNIVYPFDQLYLMHSFLFKLPLRHYVLHWMKRVTDWEETPDNYILILKTATEKIYIFRGKKYGNSTNYSDCIWKLHELAKNIHVWCKWW